LAEFGWQVGRNHAEQFVPALAETISRLGRTPAEIDLIAVGCGPGSYTGIRIGLAMGEALSIALDRPLTGVPTLAALAQNAAGYPGPVCAALAARRGEVYAAVYKGGMELIPTAIFTPENLRVVLADLDRERPLLLGSGAERLRAGSGDALHTWVPGEINLPRGAAVARLGAAAPGRPARPIYLRPTEAEARAGKCGRPA